MSVFVLLLLSVVFFSVFVVGGVYLLYRLLINFQPSKNKIDADIEQLKEELGNWASELIPWKTDELELLSLNQSNKTTKRGITTTVKGMYTSIYHEPMVAYAYKKYVSSGKKNAILYARTSEHEFVYRLRNKEVEIRIDNELVGVLKQDGQLYAARSNRMIAQIRRNDQSTLLPIVVGDRELASLPKSMEDNTANSRAFQFLEENRNDQEETLILSLAVLELVSREQSQ